MLWHTAITAYTHTRARIEWQRERNDQPIRLSRSSAHAERQSQQSQFEKYPKQNTVRIVQWNTVQTIPNFIIFLHLVEAQAFATTICWRCFFLYIFCFVIFFFSLLTFVHSFVRFNLLVVATFIWNWTAYELSIFVLLSFLSCAAFTSHLGILWERQ